MPEFSLIALFLGLPWAKWLVNAIDSRGTIRFFLISGDVPAMARTVLAGIGARIFSVLYSEGEGALLLASSFRRSCRKEEKSKGNPVEKPFNNRDNKSKVICCDVKGNRGAQYHCPQQR